MHAREVGEGLTLNSCFFPMRSISRSSTTVPPFWMTAAFVSSLPTSSIEMRSSALVSGLSMLSARVLSLVGELRLRNEGTSRGPEVKSKMVEGQAHARVRFELK